MSWNRAPAPGTRAPAPRNPQIPDPTGLGIIGGIVPISVHNVVLGRDNPMRPNTITVSLQGFPIQRFVTHKATQGYIQDTLHCPKHEGFSSSQGN